MTISTAVQNQFFHDQRYLIRIPTNNASNAAVAKRKSGAAWTPVEHNRFLEALERYPSGPWKYIAAYVQTRTTRQTMTHAQKYREKIARHTRSPEPMELATQTPNTLPPFSKVHSSTVQPVNGLTRERHNAAEYYASQRSFYTAFGDSPNDDTCIDAAITSLLDEYEPFELLSADTISSELWNTWCDDDSPVAAPSCNIPNKMYPTL